jgi:hypothetical protein
MNLEYIIKILISLLYLIKLLINKLKIIYNISSSGK